MYYTTAQSYNPGGHAHRFGLFRVRSPLLTESLLVFFSSAYLDVSVQRVCDISCSLQLHRFPHSDIYGYNGRLHLPVAFRSLPRPSSPPRAKASPIRPSFASNSLLRGTHLRGAPVAPESWLLFSSYGSISLDLSYFFTTSFPVLSMNVWIALYNRARSSDPARTRPRTLFHNPLADNLASKPIHDRCHEAPRRAYLSFNPAKPFQTLHGERSHRISVTNFHLFQMVSLVKWRISDSNR